MAEYDATVGESRTAAVVVRARTRAALVRRAAENFARSGRICCICHMWNAPSGTGAFIEPPNGERTASAPALTAAKKPLGGAETPFARIDAESGTEPSVDLL